MSKMKSKEHRQYLILTQEMSGLALERYKNCIGEASATLCQYPCLLTEIKANV